MQTECSSFVAKTEVLVKVCCEETGDGHGLLQYWLVALRAFCGQEATGINNTNTERTTGVCFTKQVQLSLALFGLPGFTESLHWRPLTTSAAKLVFTWLSELLS